ARAWPGAGPGDPAEGRYLGAAAVRVGGRRGGKDVPGRSRQAQQPDADGHVPDGAHRMGSRLDATAQRLGAWDEAAEGRRPAKPDAGREDLLPGAVVLHPRDE